MAAKRKSDFCVQGDFEKLTKYTDKFHNKEKSQISYIILAKTANQYLKYGGKDLLFPAFADRLLTM